MEITYSIAGFIVCALLITFGGTRLTYLGDRLAELTGLGRARIGLILMASVTSLPELVTGISSVVIIDAPNLAGGNIFGSCIFNLLILSLIDARIKKPLTSIIKTSHLFSGLFGIILITICGAAILLNDSIGQIFWISPFSLLLILVYLVAVWGIFHFENEPEKAITKSEAEKIAGKAELKKVLIAYGLTAVLVIVSALFLPFFGENIAKATGLGSTFFGTVFLAATTVLPELVVSITAIKMKSFDLLVGNLLGSNIFNIFILALDDLLYVKGPIFHYLLPTHLISIFAITIMTAVVGLGILAKPGKKYWLFSLDSIVIIIIYILLIIFMLTKG